MAGTKPVYVFLNNPVLNLLTQIRDFFSYLNTVRGQNRRPSKLVLCPLILVVFRTVTEPCSKHRDHLNTILSYEL